MSGWGSSRYGCVESGSVVSSGVMRTCLKLWPIGFSPDESTSEMRSTTVLPITSRRPLTSLRLDDKNVAVLRRVEPPLVRAPGYARFLDESERFLDEA